MLTRPTLPLTRALRTLRQHPLWVDVKVGLEAELRAVYESMRDNHTTNVLLKLSGRAQALSDFLEAVEQADETLESLEKRRDPPRAPRI